MDNKKKIHGNNARVDRYKKLESVNSTNLVTLINKYGSDKIRESNVIEAKRMVDENHK